MRKLCCGALCLLLTLLFFLPAFGASEAQQNQESGYTAMIDDPAGLLTSDQAAEVLAAMMPVTEYANVGFATYAASGNSQTAVLEKARRWGDERFGGDTPYTVFMIDMKTRRLGIYSSRQI